MAAYLVATAVRREPIRIYGFSLPLPTPALATRQLLISALDWTLAGAALYVVLGAIGLLAIISRPRGMWPSIALACCGGIVMLLASTVMVAQLIGVLDGVTTGPFIGSSLQASLGALVFSTYFNALVWSKEAGFSAPPSWLPLSVGAGSLITVLLCGGR